MEVSVGDSNVTPRDFLTKVAPDPARLGDRMTGKTCAGTWIKGRKEGLEREVYLYQVADNRMCMDRWGCQAVVAQTAFSPVIMMELLAKNIWSGSGVCAPEAFNPDPFVARMAAYGFPGGHMEMASEFQRRIERERFTLPLEKGRQRDYL
jgi:saccharopine dehydrogenase-like NADP-dependent oxidoreductase